MNDSKLILNNPEYNVKVLTTIQDALHECNSFIISVAFITESGITPLLQDLKELEEKGVKGRILTTDYLAFSEPKALERLDKLENIEVRLYQVRDNYGFHSKGYIFKNSTDYTILIGSSNLTQKALTVNMEWNLLTKNTSNTKLVHDINNSFNYYWNKSVPVTDCINEYKEYYNQSKTNTILPPRTENTLKPNHMQEKFIENFRKTVQDGQKRGLLISTTGTGKTYASAFALKEVKPKRILFLVHREQIAKQAMETYKHVFGSTYTYGLFTGNNKDYDAEILFSTIQTMSQEEYYHQFKSNTFDYIVIDEVHHAGAKSYQEIINYFRPEFYLGMTGSPDRTDEFDIYDLFNHNIIYEIRLKDALNEHMLCDFHYFGIDDQMDTNYLSDKHIDMIIENLEYYGYYGNRVKGLVFCNNNRNAKLLSDEFNKRGYNTTSLSGENTLIQREKTIQRLVTDSTDNKLDYIFTVDIFNEGVDIPEINQVVMLRPTQSSIIFIQQLGRGLRKNRNKEYVVVLDFIGNYNNNYMIPVALSDDRSYNKDKIRKFMFDYNNLLPGSSTINFEKIAKEKIYQSIDKARFNTIAFLRNKYINFKNKIGYIPQLIDYYNYDELDITFITDYMRKKLPSNNKAYPVLVEKLDKDYISEYTPLEILYMEFITLKLVNGKRPHELEILDEIIKNNTIHIHQLDQKLKEKYNLQKNKKAIKNSIKILTITYYKHEEKKKYSNVKLITYNRKDKTIQIHKQFTKLLKNRKFKKQIQILITLGLKQYKGKYNTDETFILYEKYSREDTSRLLCWKENEATTIFGYRTGTDMQNNKQCPMFVTYDKRNNKETNRYECQLLDNKTMYWMSKNKRTIESPDVKEIIQYKENKLEMLLFMKKSDAEDKEYFYYMGKVHPTAYKQEKDKTGNDIVKFKLELHTPIRKDIYQYMKN